MTPETLIGAAEELLAGSAKWMSGAAPRAAALLARQSIEESMARLWRARAPGLEKCSFHAQLLCLPLYVRDREVAESAAYAWAAFTRVCHHHAYELVPNAMELRSPLEAARRLARATLQQH